MQLYDKDLLSVQEVRELVAKAKAAQFELSEKSQEEVDRIVKAIAEAGVRNAARLGAMAHEETGFGTAEDKTIKNIFASDGVYQYIKDMKTVGELERDEERRLRIIAVPVGVIAGLIPSTNPTSTAFYKSEISVKAGNAIIFSPHPNARNCILEAVKVIRQAIAEAGGNEDLVSCITIPTIQATDNLMKHPDVALILATGGSAMVRAAYSSGTPAIGVGPGNGPAYIERTADVPLAVKRIMDSKTFDNGTICASEQSIVTETGIADQVKEELKKQGGYFLTKEQSDKLSGFLLRANGTMNPKIVGRTALKIAEMAGITVPAGTKLLVSEQDPMNVNKKNPYSREKLCPVIAFFTVDGWEAACELSIRILQNEGAGHTMTLHTKNKDVVREFALRKPVSRILVNTPGALGGVGASTGLAPALTLGCGAVGGSATSDNITPMNLINIRRVAWGLCELEDLRKGSPVPKDEPSCGCGTKTDLSAEDIEAITREIMKRLGAGLGK